MLHMLTHTLENKEVIITGLSQYYQIQDVSLCVCGHMSGGWVCSGEKSGGCLSVHFEGGDVQGKVETCDPLIVCTMTGGHTRLHTTKTALLPGKAPV